MYKFLFLILVTILSLGCQGASNESNSDLNKAVNAPVVITNQANIPPEFQSNQAVISNGAATPGIPDPKNVNANIKPDGKTTPGIPDPKTLNKAQPKNTPPIPGIPSEAELKKQMSRPVSIDEVNNPKNPAPANAPPVGSQKDPNKKP